MWHMVHVCLLSRFSCVQLFVTQWTEALQTPLSLGFFRQEHWSGLPCPSPADLPNPDLLYCRWILYELSHKGSLRILEWVAYLFSSRSSQPRNRTRVSCIAGGSFTKWAIREALIFSIKMFLWKFRLLVNCLLDVSSWMSHGHLEFNKSKTRLQTSFQNLLSSLSPFSSLGWKC